MSYAYRQHKKEPLRKAWRKRLAEMSRRFKKARGHWPSESIILAAKLGIEQCIRAGQKPTVEN